jgi:hypothetical protein
VQGLCGVPPDLEAATRLLSNLVAAFEQLRIKASKLATTEEA